jgi:hypothetical protein
VTQPHATVDSSKFGSKIIHPKKTPARAQLSFPVAWSTLKLLNKHNLFGITQITYLSPSKSKSKSKQSHGPFSRWEQNGTNHQPGSQDTHGHGHHYCNINSKYSSSETKMRSQDRHGGFMQPPNQANSMWPFTCLQTSHTPTPGSDEWATARRWRQQQWSGAARVCVLTFPPWRNTNLDGDMTIFSSPHTSMLEHQWDSMIWPPCHCSRSKHKHCLHLSNHRSQSKRSMDHIAPWTDELPWGKRRALAQIWRLLGQMTDHNLFLHCNVTTHYILPVTSQLGKNRTATDWIITIPYWVAAYHRSTY